MFFSSYYSVAGNSFANIASLISPGTEVPSSLSPVQLGVTSTSPLQRMASITNSLVTGSSFNSSHHLNAKPAKAVLPPITQQQFDMHSNINTEEIVKSVSFIILLISYLIYIHSWHNIIACMGMSHQCFSCFIHFSIINRC